MKLLQIALSLLLILSSIACASVHKTTSDETMEETVEWIESMVNANSGYSVPVYTETFRMSSDGNTLILKVVQKGRNLEYFKDREETWINRIPIREIGDCLYLSAGSDTRNGPGLKIIIHNKNKSISIKKNKYKEVAETGEIMDRTNYDKDYSVSIYFKPNTEDIVQRIHKAFSHLIKLNRFEPPKPPVRKDLF
jgi:hypothetical protein